MSLEGACTHLWYLGFRSCTKEDAPLDSLASVTSGASIGGSHRTIPNKKGSYRPSLQGSVQRRQKEMSAPSLSPIAAAQGAGFLSAGIYSWLRPSSLRHWQVLVSLQLLRATSNKGGGWDNHKRLRDRMWSGVTEEKHKNNIHFP